MGPFTNWATQAPVSSSFLKKAHRSSGWHCLSLAGTYWLQSLWRPHNARARAAHNRTSKKPADQGETQPDTKQLSSCPGPVGGGKGNSTRQVFSLFKSTRLNGISSPVLTKPSTCCFLVSNNEGESFWEAKSYFCIPLPTERHNHPKIMGLGHPNTTRWGVCAYLLRSAGVLLTSLSAALSEEPWSVSQRALWLSDVMWWAWVRKKSQGFKGGHNHTSWAAGQRWPTLNWNASFSWEWKVLK